MVGHSLGGALAAIVAANMSSCPTRGLTFNAPGMKGVTRFGNYTDPALNEWTAGMGRAAAAFTLNPVVGVATTLGLRAFARAQVDSETHLNLSGKNEHSVFNVRSQDDVVSRAKGNFIGQPPYVVRNAGLHGMGPLIEALTRDPIGSFRI